MKSKAKQRIPSPPPTPTLRFSPTAWAKLQLLCHHGETEIGGFGIAETEDPLLVTDFITVKQRASPVSVEFDDQAVADFFDRQVDQGLRPEQFARTWLHTHPGDSPRPSGTDARSSLPGGNLEMVIRRWRTRDGRVPTAATMQRGRRNLPAADPARCHRRR